MKVKPVLEDLALAAVCALVLFGTALWERAPVHALVLAGFSVAAAAPLVLRRRVPLTAATATAVVVLCGLAVPRWSGGLVAAVAFCSAAYHRPRRLGVVLAVSATYFLVPLLVGARPPEGLPERAMPMLAGVGTTPVTQAVLIGIAPVAAGYALRLRHERVDQLARLHRAEAVRAAAEERAMIARDVHDAVGHHLTAIQMQAGAARHVLGDAPSVATTALGTIGDSASSALREVRTLLKALRDNVDGVLADVGALAQRVATPLCAITVERTGPAGPLPALPDHGGYRLVQEALTNAVRHSGARHIHVRIARAAGRITIAVEDDGPTTPSDFEEGQGIRGMRERVRLLGGSLHLEPREPHGWRVRAELPIDGGG